MGNTSSASPAGYERYLIGVDVGTGSARAGLFDLSGRMLASSKRDISLFREAGAMAEQSSTEISAAICAAVREAMGESGIAPDLVVGIGFDATCSLVVLGKGGAPLPVGPSEDPDRNIIVWMDHRAVEQVETVLLGAAILGSVAGGAFPDMRSAMAALSATDRAYHPAGGETAAIHDARYAAFTQIQELARKIR